MKTHKQIKGIKFEIWLEYLLRLQGYQNVLRNVEYHKERFRFRQVDISYDLVNNKEIHRAIIEAKYSSNGRISYKLRQSKFKKDGQRIIRIDNLVDETLERQRFVNADIAFLVTNHGFDAKVKQEARKHKIKVLEGKRLEEIYHHYGGKGPIDNAIRSVSIKAHNPHRNIIYLS
jgi:hypothetical protein